MQTQRVEFDNGSGQQLKGLLDLPAGTPRAFALFAHCFTCGKNLKSAQMISETLAGAGIATLRFDFTGLGQSEGDFAETTFSSNVKDLLAACHYLDAEWEAPQLLLGHSLGGTAVLQAAAKVGSARAVATIGSPARPTHVEHLLDGAEDALARDGVADVSLGGRTFQLKRGFLDDLRQHDLPAQVRKLRKALLIFHSPLDEIVEIDNASELYQEALHPKSFVSLDQADHLLSNLEDARYVGATLAAWAERYLEAPAAVEIPEGWVEARTDAGGFKTLLRSAHHEWVADEPASVPGGTNLGPSPYDLLTSALASCTSMTLQMYARHKKLPLESAVVRVRHARIHADDCAECEKADGMIDQFDRTLTLTGPLDAATRERMLEIADRCPVHKTLHNEIRIVTELEANV